MLPTIFLRQPISSRCMICTRSFWEKFNRTSCFSWRYRRPPGPSLDTTIQRCEHMRAAMWCSSGTVGIHLLSPILYCFARFWCETIT